MSGKRKEAIHEYAIKDGATEISIVKESRKQPRVHFTCYCGEAYSKRNGCILAGYKFEFWIYDKKLVKSLA
jgi:rRNA maturation protein Rpf1